MNNNIGRRLLALESRIRKTLLPLVVFYRSENGLSSEQRQRISDAKAEGRSIKLIRTTVVAGVNEGCNG